MSSHFASHVQESLLGSGGERVASASIHDMQALKQLACAVIHRAIDDAEGVGPKVEPNDIIEAKAFLCNADELLVPWAVLAGVRLDAVVEYALRRGYNHTDVSPVNNVRGVKDCNAGIANNIPS